MEIFNLEQELEKYQPSLLNYAFSLTHNRDEAWDIVQDVNYLVLANRDKFESRQYPFRISFTFIKNRFISLWRAKKDIENKIIHLDSEKQYHFEPYDKIVIYQDYYYIMNIINQLTEQERVLTGLLIEGKHYDEIGKIMGVKKGTVKSRIHSLRKKLKGLFSEVIDL